MSDPEKTEFENLIHQDGAAEKLSGLHVLIADDSAANRTALSTMCSQLGMSCKLAADGVEAVELWRKHDFDVILLDISMPRWAGTDALKQISDEGWILGRKVPCILAVTANVMAEQISHYREAGFAAVVPKPFRKDQLVNLISQSLAR